MDSSDVPKLNSLGTAAMARELWNDFFGDSDLMDQHRLRFMVRIHGYDIMAIDM